MNERISPRNVRIKNYKGIEELIPLPLDKETEKAIGSNGVDRYYKFCRYKAGWDFGQGESLKPNSLSVMEKFIKLFKGFDEIEPSLFLTLNGNLQLNWEDKHDGIIEIGFGTESIEYYLETEDKEKSIRIEDLPQLIDNLNDLCNGK